MDCLLSGGNMPTNNRQNSGYESFDSGALMEDFSSPLAHFETEIKDLSNPNSSTGRLVCAFIQRELRNFHLDKLYDVTYIINSSYLRGRQKIQDGVPIQNPTAWIRSVSFNVIRELSRQEKKTVPLDLHPEIESPQCIQDSDLEIELSKLRLAFQMLPYKEQCVLNLKIVEGLSYEQISIKLRIQGQGDYSVLSLRKLKERSLKKLRTLFHSISIPNS
jgi:hypothetical protein